MSELILRLWENEETDYTYEVVFTDEGEYRVWVETSPIRGKFLPGKHERCIDALEELVNCIKQGELV